MNLGTLSIHEKPMAKIIIRVSQVAIRRTMYITEEQAEYLKEATTMSSTGDFTYDAPMSKGREKDDFYVGIC